MTAYSRFRPNFWPVGSQGPKAGLPQTLTSVCVCVSDKFYMFVRSPSYVGGRVRMTDPTDRRATAGYPGTDRHPPPIIVPLPLPPGARTRAPRATTRTHPLWPRPPATSAP